MCGREVNIDQGTCSRCSFGPQNIFCTTKFCKDDRSFHYLKYLVQQEHFGRYQTECGFDNPGRERGREGGRDRKYVGKALGTGQERTERERMSDQGDSHMETLQERGRDIKGKKNTEGRV